jgi:RNA polymerase subunit RPABC4/transcription elongation factor Spt4
MEKKEKCPFCGSKETVIKGKELFCVNCEYIRPEEPTEKIINFVETPKKGK